MQITRFIINNQKPIVLLYITDKSAEMKLGISPIHNSLKKCSGINLTKELNDLYNEKYKTFKKVIEEELRILKDLPHSWIGRINMLKWPYYQKHYRDLIQFL